MSDFEVPEAIICSPFEEPTHYWRLEEGAEPEKRPGRRPAIYYYPDPISQDSAGTMVPKGTAIELKLVSLIRSRVKEWRAAGYPGVTATTLERSGGGHIRHPPVRSRIGRDDLDPARDHLSLNSHVGGARDSDGTGGRPTGSPAKTIDDYQDTPSPDEALPAPGR